MTIQTVTSSTGQRYEIITTEPDISLRELRADNARLQTALAQSHIKRAALEVARVELLAANTALQAKIAELQTALARAEALSIF